MFHRFRLVFLLILVMAVLVITAQVVFTQEAPPRPSRTIEELPRLPGTAVEEKQRPTDAGPSAILPWSKRTFQSYRDGNWEIYTSNDDGSGETRLTVHGATDMHPRLNRGATRIAFTSKRDGSYEVYTMNVDGSGVTRLTFSGSDNVYPAWSPDGTKIAFQSYRDGQAEIYVMNANGSGQTRLTANAGFDGYPAWSPDGSRLAFSSSRSGQVYIYVMNANGSGVTQLSNQIYSYNPVWSPDGSKIAYDADQDNDGWQELWVMDASGANQQMKYDPYGQTDAWAHSWSPDGRHITYTLIRFTYYQGAWYWVDAFLEMITPSSGATTRLSSSGFDWNPDWQTLDIIRPTVTVPSLPDISPAPIVIRWSGSDAGGAGVKGYDVQVKTGINGAWVNWLANTTLTSSAYTAVGGQTYAFRIRARDNAHNVSDWSPVDRAVTTVETLPPQTAVERLPPYSRLNYFTVTWNGIDPGGSGIQSYDVQYRVDAGSWVNWLSAISETSSVFFPDSASIQAGQTVSFRSRAVDHAGNQETWSTGSDDTITRFYTWGITGIGHDNAGTPLSDIQVNINSATFAHVANTADGAYAGYTLADYDQYAVAWDRPGLGSLPSTWFLGEADAVKDIYLPPANDLWINGGFEDGPPGPNHTSPVVTDTNFHTGKQALLMSSDEIFAPSHQVSNALDQAQSPEAATDSNGNLHVVWKENDDLGSHVSYTFRNTNGVWSSPINISPGINTVYDPKLTVSGNTVHVMFEAYATGLSSGNNLYYTSRNAGGIWNTPYQVNGSAPSGPYQFAVAHNGDVHVIWKHGTFWMMFYSHRAANGAWAAPYLLTPSSNLAGPVDFPNIVVDSNNNAHMVWYYHQAEFGGWTRIEFATRSATGQWTRHEPVISSSQDEYTVLHLHVDAANHLHLLWYDEIPESNDVPDENILFYARYNGNSWSSPQRVTAQGFLYQGDISLVSDSAGNLHLLWVNHEPDTVERVLYRQRRANGVWNTPVVLFSDIGRQPFLAVQDDQIFAAWTFIDFDSETAQIVLTKKDSTGDWSAPTVVMPGFFGSNQPRLVSDVNDGLHVIWQEGSWYYSDPDTQIYHTKQQLAEFTEAIRYSYSLTLPVTMTNSVVSYLYQLTNGSTADDMGLFIDIADSSGVTTTAAHTTDRAAWTHSWVDVSPWAGDTVTITFRLQQQAGQPIVRAYLDDVSLGIAHPDVWVTANETSGLPGEQIAHTLTYGNRGGGIAAGTRLTYTLPAELSFVSASLPPISTSPLMWELGDLPAKSEPFTLSVVVQMLPTAVPFSTLTSTTVIQPADSELETLNNSTQGETFVGNRLYLPAMQR